MTDWCLSISLPGSLMWWLGPILKFDKSHFVMTHSVCILHLPIQADITLHRIPRALSHCIHLASTSWILIGNVGHQHKSPQPHLPPSLPMFPPVPDYRLHALLVEEHEEAHVLRRVLTHVARLLQLIIRP